MIKPQILVVDDEEPNLDNIRFYLNEAGYDVTGADDGAIALQKLRALGQDRRHRAGPDDAEHGRHGILK